MLPLIRAACQRWLNHERVYTPVQEVWGGESIPYLPAMWMPFVPSVLLGIDMRWTCIAATVASVLVLLVVLIRRRPSGVGMVTLPVFAGLFLLIKFWTWEDSGLFELSEEAVPAFYFVMLFIGIMYEMDWLTGTMLALCTLSRFSLLPFVPFFFLWLLINGSTKRAIKIGLIYAGLVLVLFALPFFIQQPKYFLAIPGSYMKHLDSYWQQRQYTLLGSRDLGMAYVFGYEYRGLMATISSVLLVLVPVAWLGGYVIIKKRLPVRENIWAMAGLKLTLLVFYNFISLPFLYIFVVPTLISYPLLLAVCTERKFEK